MNKYQELLKEYIGETKPYKEWCYILGEQQLNRKSKELQLNKWQQYIEIYRPNGKITLVDIYDDEKIYKLKHESYIKYLSDRCNDNRYDSFNISYLDAHKGGIYKIQLLNTIYIGQTNNFQHRFKMHCNNEKMYNFIIKGAKMSIIETDDDLESRLKKEMIYIKDYANNPKYNCLNFIYNNKDFKIKINSNNRTEVIKFLNDNNIYYEEQ